MIDASRFDGADETQSQPVVTGTADLDEVIGLVGDADHLLLGHRNRPAGDVADDVRIDLPDDFPARQLAHAGARHAAGMNLYFDAPRTRPLHVALGFAIGQQAVVIENELDQPNAKCGDFVEVFLHESGNQKQCAGMDFDPGRPQVVVAALRNDRH